MGLKHAPTCPTCGALGTRIEQFDAYACKPCNTWLEGPCGKDCAFCNGRPDKPDQPRKPKTTIPTTT